MSELQLSLLQKQDPEAIRAIQLLLNTQWSYRLRVDGVIGPRTRQALCEVQVRCQLPSTGIINSATLTALLKPIITTPNISILDNPAHTERTPNYEWAARTLQCEVAAIRAVASVESAGSGFLPDNRPKILFERHWMYARLKHYGINPKPLTVQHPNIINKTPGGYKGGVAEHVRLELAKTIHVESALESASWGAFQIMGLHWQSLGYPSIQSMVDQLYSSEQAHLEVFVKFIQQDGRLLSSIRQKNWLKFALAYNGPKQKGYDKKMALAYKKFA